MTATHTPVDTRIPASRLTAGNLADDFFLMTHDDLSGKPRLSSRILGLGLAGALLGELMLHSAVDIVDDDLAPLPREPLPGFLGDMVETLYLEDRLPVRDWLTYFARKAPDHVGERLGGHKLTYFKQSRLDVLRGAGRWLPADTSTACYPAIDVKLKIRNGNADTHHLMLLGLTAATGLNNPSLWEIRDRLQDPAVLAETLRPLGEPQPRDPEAVTTARARLGRRLPLWELLTHLEAAVGSAVISQRVG